MGIFTEIQYGARCHQDAYRTQQKEVKLKQVYCMQLYWI